MKSNKNIKKADYLIISCLCLGLVIGLFLPISVGTIFSVTLLMILIGYSCWSIDVNQKEQN